MRIEIPLLIRLLVKPGEVAQQPYDRPGSRSPCSSAASWVAAGRADLCGQGDRSPCLCSALESAPLQRLTSMARRHTIDNVEMDVYSKEGCIYVGIG